MSELLTLLKTLISTIFSHTLSRNTIMVIFLTTSTMIVGFFIISAYYSSLLVRINTLPTWVYAVCLFCFYFLIVDRVDSKKKIKIKTENDKTEKERKLKEKRMAQEEREKRLHNLSSEEKAILRGYLDNDTKTQHFSIFGGTHSGLISAKILYQSSMVSYPGRETFDYNISSWAWDYLQKHPELLEKNR